MKRGLVPAQYLLLELFIRCSRLLCNLRIQCDNNINWDLAKILIYSFSLISAKALPLFSTKARCTPF